jgi:hypothetical protein
VQRRAIAYERYWATSASYYDCWLRFLLFRRRTNTSQCSDNKVQYASFDANYAKRITLEVTTNTQVAAGESEKHYSPQRTTWELSIEPNYTTNSSWITVIYVGFSDGSEPLKLSFIDHANGGVQVEWLNEKLLFGRVWWGRIYSTDFILDVQKRDFIYKEMAHYGDMIQPCQ